MSTLGKPPHTRESATRAVLRRALIGIGIMVLGVGVWTLADPGAESGARSPSGSRPPLLSSTSQPGSNSLEVRSPERLSFPAPTGDPAPPAPSVRPSAPTHLWVPSAAIDTPIVTVGSRVATIEGQRVREWEVAEYAAGHHDTSARPGERGNIVLAGHSDWRGSVFGTLDQVALGDPILIQTEDGQVHRYRVTEIHYRKELGASLAERLATGAFIGPTEDERVTLVSCWPPLVDDHRLIVIAHPEEARMTP